MALTGETYAPGVASETRSQYLKIAVLLDGKAAKTRNPERAKAMAKVYRQLARRAYERKPDAIDRIGEIWRRQHSKP